MCHRVEDHHGPDPMRRGWPAQVGAGDRRVNIEKLPVPPCPWGVCCAARGGAAMTRRACHREPRPSATPDLRRSAAALEVLDLRARYVSETDDRPRLWLERFARRGSHRRAPVARGGARPPALRAALPALRRARGRGATRRTRMVKREPWWRASLPSSALTAASPDDAATARAGHDLPRAPRPPGARGRRGDAHGSVRPRAAPAVMDRHAAGFAAGNGDGGVAMTPPASTGPARVRVHRAPAPGRDDGAAHAALARGKGTGREPVARAASPVVRRAGRDGPARGRARERAVAEADGCEGARARARAR